MRKTARPLMIYGCVATDENAIPEWRDNDPAKLVPSMELAKADGLIVTLGKDGMPQFDYEHTIPMVNITGPKRKKHDMLIRLADRGYDTIAAGNCKGEWQGKRADMDDYADMADRHGIDIIPTITHRSICLDLTRKPKDQFRTTMIERNLSGICLCGMVLCGYIYADPDIPHQGFSKEARGGKWQSLAGRDLHREFGLSYERLSEYLHGMTVMTGVGGQAGIEAGMLVYAQMVGFKGIVCRPPFSLAGLWDMKVYEPVEHYPSSCGVTGYRPSKGGVDAGV